MTSCLLDGALHLDIQQWGLSSTVWISLRNYPQQPKLSSPVYFSVIIILQTPLLIIFLLLLLPLNCFFSPFGLSSSFPIFSLSFLHRKSSQNSSGNSSVNLHAWAMSLSMTMLPLTMCTEMWHCTDTRTGVQSSKGCPQSTYRNGTSTCLVEKHTIYEWCLSRAPSEVHTKVQSSRGCPLSHTKYQYTLLF